MQIKRTKAQLKRRSMYGMVKIKKNQKYCWIAQENKHGWSLGLAINKKNIWLKNVRFASRKELEWAMENTNIVFVHLKNSKETKTL